MPGVDLSAVGASQVLQRISSNGAPPGDVLNALVVPNGARIIDTTAQDAGVDQYDRSIYFQRRLQLHRARQVLPSGAEASRLVLPRDLPAAHRRNRLPFAPTGPDPTATNGGWRVITTVNPSISPSLAGDGQTSPVMGLRLRLFEVPDGGS